MATPRCFTRAGNSEGITHPESRPSGQGCSNESSSLPSMSEIKSDSRSQRVHASESQSTHLEDSADKAERGMASTGDLSSWESHKYQCSGGGACKDETRSSGRNGVPSMFGGHSACKRSYGAGETGRAASSTVLNNETSERNSRSLRNRRTLLNVSVLGEIHNLEEYHLQLPTDRMDEIHHIGDDLGNDDIQVPRNEREVELSNQRDG